MWFEDDLDKQIANINKLKDKEKHLEATYSLEKRKNKIKKMVRLGFSYKTIEKAEKKKKPKERIREKPRSYETYINSKVWEKRRNKYWKEHKRICRACGSKNFIQLHHGIYGVFDGSEKDVQLFPLCIQCHRDFHNEHGSKRDMMKETELFILKAKG